MHMHYVKICLICIVVKVSLARGFGDVTLYVISKCPEPSTEVSRPKVQSILVPKCLESEVSDILMSNIALRAENSCMP